MTRPQPSPVMRPVMPGDPENCGCGKPVVAIVATEFGESLICDSFRR